MPIIAIALQAGGVGKTTLTFNLGALLAQQGKKVLVIDTDGQCNLTEACNAPYDQTKTLYQVLVTSRDEDESKRLSPRAAIVRVPIRESLFLLPGDSKMSIFDLTIAPLSHREYLLQEVVDQIRDDYDFVLIDCPPGLGMVLTNALFAADQVIIPVQTRKRRVNALPIFLKVLTGAMKFRPHLRVAGIVPTQYMRTAHDQGALEYIERFAKKWNFPLFDPIPTTTRVNEADDKHLPLADYEQQLKGPLTAAADALQELARRIALPPTVAEPPSPSAAAAAV